MPVCSVITCVCGIEDQNVSDQAITFHRFPANEEMKAKWVDMTGRDNWEPGSDSFVCSRHFRENDFFTRRSGKRYLKTCAIPCEYVVYKINDDEPLLEPANEPVVKVECVENELNEFEEDTAAVGEQADPEPVQEPKYEQEDEQTEPTRPYSPLTVRPVHEADSTMANIYEPWEHFRPGYFEPRLPASIFEDTGSQELDTSFEARYRRETARNPYPPDLSSSMQQVPPRAPEQVETERPKPVAEPIVRLKKLEDIEAIMSHRRSSKKDNIDDEGIPQVEDEPRGSRRRKSRRSVPRRCARPHGMSSSGGG